MTIKIEKKRNDTLNDQQADILAERIADFNKRFISAFGLIAGTLLSAGSLKLSAETILALVRGKNDLKSAVDDLESACLGIEGIANEYAEGILDSTDLSEDPSVNISKAYELLVEKAEKSRAIVFFNPCNDLIN